MALRWQWDEKCGEAVIQQTFNGETKEFTVNLYEGNCFLIFLREWEEDGKGKYSMWCFFADENHAKSCLGLKKDSESFFGGYQKLLKIKINKKKHSQWKKVITLFAQAFDNITIEVFNE